MHVLKVYMVCAWIPEKIVCLNQFIMYEFMHWCGHSSTGRCNPGWATRVRSLCNNMWWQLSTKRSVKGMVMSGKNGTNHNKPIINYHTKIETQSELNIQTFIKHYCIYWTASQAKLKRWRHPWSSTVSQLSTHDGYTWGAMVHPLSQLSGSQLVPNRGQRWKYAETHPNSSKASKLIRWCWMFTTTETLPWQVQGYRINIIMLNPRGCCGAPTKLCGPCRRCRLQGTVDLPREPCWHSWLILLMVNWVKSQQLATCGQECNLHVW